MSIYSDLQQLVCSSFLWQSFCDKEQTKIPSNTEPTAPLLSSVVHTFNIFFDLEYGQATSAVKLRLICLDKPTLLYV